jgi:hypothetical protein
VFDWVVSLLLTDISPTVSVIELIWTVPACVAWLRYGNWAIRAFRVQRRARQTNQRLSLQMRESIRTQRFLFLSFVSECMTGIGILAITQPPTPAQAIESPIGLVVPLLLISVEWAIILKGEIINRHENALLWLYEQESVAAKRDGRPPDVVGHLLP